MTNYLFKDYYFYLTLSQIIYTVCTAIELYGSTYFKQIILVSAFLIVGRIMITQMNVLKTYSENTKLLSTLSILNPIAHFFTLSLSAVLGYLLIKNEVYILITAFAFSLEGCNIIYFLYYFLDNKDKHQYTEVKNGLLTIDNTV